MTGAITRAIEALDDLLYGYEPSATKAEQALTELKELKASQDKTPYEQIKAGLEDAIGIPEVIWVDFAYDKPAIFKQEPKGDNRTTPKYIKAEIHEKDLELWDADSIDKDEEIERLREALRFYAKEENYHEDFETDFPFRTTKIQHDFGHKARLVLLGDKND